ncbi:MAG: NgoFVII family restriction endonuclease [Moraxellaceae bacterium]|nr:NgoFVII family restriction endonuclease [Moraxellaceae bacterium]
MEIVFNDSNSNNHLKVLTELMLKSDEMIFCSGWVKIEGLKLIAKELSLAIKRNAKITLITNKEHTNQECIEYLKEYNVNHIIIDSSKRYFHTKMYYFVLNDNYNVLIGSANLTSGALKSNEELSVLTSGKIGDNEHKKIALYLERISREYNA